MENNTQKMNSRKVLTVYVAFVIAFIFLFIMFIGEVNAQVYNKCASRNVIYDEAVDEATGEVLRVKVDVDRHGNADGNQYDLAVDGAFQGETVAVLHLYTGEGFDFSLPKAALKEKFDLTLLEEYGAVEVYRVIGNNQEPIVAVE